MLTGPAPELVQGCCSYGAHFSATRPTASASSGWPRSYGRGVAVQEAVRTARRPDQGRTPTARPSPAWSITLASSSTGPASRRRRLRAAPGRPAARRAPARLEARGLLAASLCAASTRPTSTVTSPRPCGSGSAATGAKGARSSTGGARTIADAFVGRHPVYETLRDELVEMVRRGGLRMFVDHVPSAETARRSPTRPSRSEAHGRSRRGSMLSFHRRRARPERPQRNWGWSTPSTSSNSSSPPSTPASTWCSPALPARARPRLAYLAADVGQQAMLCTGYLPTTATTEWTTFETIGGFQPTSRRVHLPPGAVHRGHRGGAVARDRRAEPVELRSGVRSAVHRAVRPARRAAVQASGPDASRCRSCRTASRLRTTPSRSGCRPAGGSWPR